MTRTLDVAVSNAASLSGETLIRLLGERQFPAIKLYPLSSGEDDSSTVQYLGEDLEFVDSTAIDFTDIDLLFIPVNTVRDAEMMARAVAAGCMVIDGSAGAAAMGHTIPVMPGVNDDQIEEARLNRYVAIPASPAAQLLPFLQKIHNRYGLSRVNVTACLSVASSGHEGVTELRTQTVQLLNGKPAEKKTYPHRIAYNMLPQVGDIDEHGVAAGEQYFRAEIQNILSEEIDVRVTCVTAPVFFGDSLSVDLDTEQPMDLQEVADMVTEMHGHELSEASSYPTVEEAAGSDEMQMGRMRQTTLYGTDLSFWLVSDGVKRGAIASVDVAELLIKDFAK